MSVYYMAEYSCRECEVESYGEQDSQRESGEGVEECLEDLLKPLHPETEDYDIVHIAESGFMAAPDQKRFSELMAAIFARQTSACNIEI